LGQGEGEEEEEGEEGEEGEGAWGRHCGDGWLRG